MSDLYQKQQQKSLLELKQDQEQDLTQYDVTGFMESFGEEEFSLQTDPLVIRLEQTRESVSENMPRYLHERAHSTTTVNDTASTDVLYDQLQQSRDTVQENMPKTLKESFDSERLARLLSRQDRVAVDLKGLDKNKASDAPMLKQGNLADTQKEIDEINKAIDSYLLGELSDTINEEEFETQHLHSLYFKRARDYSHLLMNEHSKSDSPEMKDVKVDVLNLTMDIEAARNVVASEKSVGDMIVSYNLALKSCDKYLNSWKRKNKRYELVKNLFLSLSMERDVLEMHRSGLSQIQEGKTIGQLLGMQEAVEGDLVRELPSAQEQDEVAVSADAAMIQKMFGEKYEFSKGESKSSARKKEATRLFELHNALSVFKPGNIQVEDIVVAGKKVRLMQKADNSIYVIDNHRQIRLDKTIDLLYNQIEKDILSNSDLYSSKSIRGLMTNYYDKAHKDIDKLTAGENTRIRTNLIEYLVKTLKMKRDDFTNVTRNDMITFATQLLNKEKNEAQIKEAIAQSNATQTMINGVELAEMMEIEDQNEERRRELESHVSVYEMEVESQANDWSEQEKAVQNLMADFVFANDTLIMDKNVKTPAEFVRQILSDNTAALATLIKENKGNDDMLTAIIKKMSLDSLTGEGGEAFADVVSSELRKLVDYFREQTGSEGSVEQIEKDVQVLLKSQDKSFIKKLADTNKAMEQGISKSCRMLQKSVSEITDDLLRTEDEKGEETLESIMKNATRTKKGQGQFTRVVMNEYFGSMSVLDQRAMLSSVLRSSRKVNTDLSDMDIIEELRSKKVKGYESLHSIGRNYTKEPLTEEEKKQINEYRDHKIKMMKGANYLGGLIRGAGPLFQKMMQGLPDDSMPDEIKKALRDVKSNLPPIPKRVIKSQINAMVESSGGTITKIVVEKNLGAASVGQTFKCRLFGPGQPAEGKSVVIKLLRPDVQNRMSREKDVMLRCASKVDKGMHDTYEGQLENYFNELDLKKEADNIKEGAVYDGKYNNVESEKINGLIDPSVNSLVLEEAEGKTLDSILVDTEKKRKEWRYDLSQKSYEDGKEKVFDSIEQSPEMFEKTKQYKNMMIDTANDLIKKRDMMANICEGWITEALFKSGYYHADLHAGNILLGDKKGTIIDYGNAVKFDSKQQSAITQMMTAAASGTVSVFFNAFNSLLDMSDEKFKEFYNEQKQQEVRDAFEKILDMGEDQQAGERISAALIKAQELGVKLPPAIYNFSQGQLRLQKSINDINEMIEKIKRDINWVDEKMDESTNDADPVSCVMNTVRMEIKRRERGPVFKQYESQYHGVDKESFVKELLDNEKKKGDVEEGIEAIDKRNDFDQKYLGLMKGFEQNLKGKENYPIPNYEECMAKYQAFKQKWNGREDAPGFIDATRTLASEIMPMNAHERVYQMFGSALFFYNQLQLGLANGDDVMVEKVLSVYRDIIPKGIEMDKKIDELRSLQDSGKLTEENKKALTDEIYDLYNFIHTHRPKAAESGFRMYLTRLSQPIEHLKHGLRNTFMEKTTTKVMDENGQEVERPLGELLEEKYTAFINDFKQYGGNVGLKDDTPMSVRKEFTRRSQELIDIHSQIAKVAIKRYVDGRFDRKVDVKSYGFTKIMKNVIKANFFKYGMNVGLGNLAEITGFSAFSVLGKLGNALFSSNKEEEE